MAAVVGRRRLPVGHGDAGIGMGHVGDGHGIGRGANSTVHAHDLTGGVGAEFGRVGAVEKTGVLRIFGHLEEVADGVGIEAAGGVVDELDEVRVPHQGGVEITLEFVPADVVQGFLFFAARKNHPGLEEIEAVAVGAADRIVGARFGEDVDRVAFGGTRAFIGPVEVAKRIARTVGLLVALEVIPAHKNHPAGGVDRRAEGAGGGVGQ